MKDGRGKAVLLACVAVALLGWRVALAECGGSQQCMAVSIDPADAPRHGTPETSAPLTFGNQAVSTASAARPILVAAVLGPVGTLATLTGVTLGGADAGDFSIASSTCTVGSPSLRHNGLAQASLADTCSLGVVFTPTSIGARSAAISVSTSAITRIIPLSGTGTSVLPGAADASFTVTADTPTTLDLTPFISGAGLTGIAVVTPPVHGIATVSGNTVLYTPDRGFLGDDAFTYRSTTATDASAPATVDVTVAGRPDPADDPTVVGLLDAQTRAVRRFSRAQIANYRERLATLRAAAAFAGPSRRSGYASYGALAPPAAGPGVYAGLPGGTGPGGIGTGPGAGPDDAKARAVAGALAGALSSGALDLGAAGGTGLPDLPGGLGVWVGGRIDFGSRDQTANGDALDFTTAGVTAGVDRRFGDDLVLGAGIGYAHDDTDIGGNGSSNEAHGWSVAGYGSYRPAENVYVDGLLGYGQSDHDSDRLTQPGGPIARAERDGDQVFASVAIGYEHRRDALLVSPYARLDLGHAWLDTATERGGGQGALTYFDESFSTLDGLLGLRLQSIHATRFGWVEPRLYLEYRHQFEGESASTVTYADQRGGPRYSVTPTGLDRDTLRLGLGNDFYYRDGLRLGLDYEVELLSDSDESQSVQLWLSKALDGPGPGWRPPETRALKNPVRVEAGYAWAENLNRTRAGGELSDHVFAAQVGQTGFFPLSENARLVLRGGLDAEKYHTFSGLDRLRGSVRGELQYRTSGWYGAPTFGAFALLGLDAYDSHLRDGQRYALGVTVRKPLSDRMFAFGEAGYRWRNAKSSVFDGNEFSARASLDYALHGWGSLYLGGEYRRGDTVTSTSSAITADSAPDDAYGGRDLVASRYEARTLLFTVGYNLPLGPRDSIDLSWTRAHAEPLSGQQFLPGSPYGGGSGGRSYTANRYSIYYLMRF